MQYTIPRNKRNAKIYPTNVSATCSRRVQELQQLQKALCQVPVSTFTIEKQNKFQFGQKKMDERAKYTAGHKLRAGLRIIPILRN